MDEEQRQPSRITHRIGCLVIGVGWLLMLAAAVACVAFYLNDDTTKAIFWLLVAVLVTRWVERVSAHLDQRLQESESSIKSKTPAWHCEYCGKLTTVPHQRCQETKGPRPPLSPSAS